MLYGCRTWILSESHLSTLSSRDWETYPYTLIGLHWPSVRCRILIRKLGYLAKLLSSDDKLSAQVIHTLVSEGVYNVSLIQQCRSLEQHLG